MDLATLLTDKELQQLCEVCPYLKERIENWNCSFVYVFRVITKECGPKNFTHKVCYCHIVRNKNSTRVKKAENSTPTNTTKNKWKKNIYKSRFKTFFFFFCKFNFICYKVVCYFNRRRTNARELILKDPVKPGRSV